MRWFQLRPTFEIPLNDDREAALAKIAAAYEQSSTRKGMLISGEYGEFHLPKDEHRLWSPHLSFYIFERDGSAIVHGRFAPRIDVWTSVWIAYLAMAFTAFFGFALAYSQVMLDKHPWGAWVGGSAILALLGLYVIAHIGQQWSADQMRSLRGRLEDFLRQANVN